MTNYRQQLRLANVLLAGALLMGVLSLSALDLEGQFAGASCRSCHVAGQQTSQSTASILQGPLEQLCSECHSGAVEASHPSAVQPSMEIDEQFPLDWKGDLTCSSCHHIHAESGVKRHGQLRVDVRGEPFCTLCHPPRFFDRMADDGGSLIISGHLDANAAPQSQLSDTYSIQCMTCHDDKADNPEGALGVTIDSNNFVRHQGGKVNHPVGVDYIQALEYGGYRPVHVLPPQIVLPGGQVSCISCHEAYSDQHGQLVVTQQGSNLCFQCHDM